MRAAGSLEAMITDPVHEGKRQEIPRDATVLYAHLGGQPALSAYGALFT